MSRAAPLPPCMLPVYPSTANRRCNFFMDTMVMVHRTRLCVHAAVCQHFRSITPHSLKACRRCPLSPFPTSSGCCPCSQFHLQAREPIRWLARRRKASTFSAAVCGLLALAIVARLPRGCPPQSLTRVAISEDSPTNLAKFAPIAKPGRPRVSGTQRI